MKKWLAGGLTGLLIGLIPVILIHLFFYFILAVWSSGWGYPGYTFIEYWNEDLDSLFINLLKGFWYLPMLLGTIIGTTIGLIIGKKRSK